MQKNPSKTYKAIAILSLLIIISGCGSTMKAKTGNTVKVDYVGTTEGKLFDTSIKEEAEKAGTYDESRDYEPLEFEVGAGQMIKGFDKAVIGMSVGEEKTVDLPPEDAYGEYSPEMTKEIPLDTFKSKGITPTVGQKLQLMTMQGPIVATVKEIKDNIALLDFNHELAGKTLTFKITLREIVS